MIITSLRLTGWIVLPLPGVAVQYPQDEIGMIYRQMLSHDGVEPLEPAIERSASRRDDDNWMELQVAAECV